MTEKEFEPYAYAYERTDLPEEMKEFYGPAFHLKRKDAIPENWIEIPLYRRAGTSDEEREKWIECAAINKNLAAEALRLRVENTLLIRLVNESSSIQALRAALERK